MRKQLSSIVLALCWSPVLGASSAGQDIRVETEQADVQVDRQGVDITADRPTEQAAERATGEARNDDPDARTNQEIAQWLLIDQRNLIELSRFGFERANSPEVQKLAELIIREHTNLSQRLLAVAGEREPRGDEGDDTKELPEREGASEREGPRSRFEGLADRLEEGVERVADRTERAVENTRRAIRRELNDGASAAPSSLAWIVIHNEIVNQMTVAAKHDLENRKGEDFESAFIGVLSAAHLQQEATLGILANRASGELSATLADTLQTVRKHRKQANAVMIHLSRSAE